MLKSDTKRKRIQTSGLPAYAVTSSVKPRKRPFVVPL